MRRQSYLVYISTCVVDGVWLRRAETCPHTHTHSGSKYLWIMIVILIAIFMIIIIIINYWITSNTHSSSFPIPKWKAFRLPRATAALPISHWIIIIIIVSSFYFSHRRHRRRRNWILLSYIFIIIIKVYIINVSMAWERKSDACMLNQKQQPIRWKKNPIFNANKKETRCCIHIPSFSVQLHHQIICFAPKRFIIIIECLLNDILHVTKNKKYKRSIYKKNL